MMFKQRNKILLICLFFFSIPLMIYANGNQDSRIEEIVKTGSKNEIKNTLKKQISLINYSSKKEKNNLVHLALQANREYPIIELLVNIGVPTTSKNINGTTPLMEACRSADEKTINLILKNDAFLSSTKQKHVLVKDKQGQNSFDYASDRPDIISFLEKQTKYSYNQNKSIQENVETIVAIPESGVITDLPQNIEPETVPEVIAESTILATPVIEEVLQEQEKEQEEEENKIDIQPQNENVEIPEVKDLEPKETEEIAETVDNSFLSDIVIKEFEPVYLFDVYEDDNSIDDKNSFTSNEKNNSENVNLADKTGRTLLMKAAADGNSKEVLRLIQQGADVNAKDKDGWTAAMFCIRYNGNASILALLAENKANLDSANNYGITPLTLASRYSDDKHIFTLLLNNRKASENEVRNAFINAISYEKSIEILEIFIKKGLPLNQLYSGGKTPLMFAAQYNTNTNIIKFLLQNKAEKKIKSQEGKYAFDYATQNIQIKHDKIYWSLNTNGEV